MTAGRTFLAALVACTVLVSAVGPGIVAADVRGEPELSVVASGGSVAPGAQTTFQVTVQNTGIIYEGSSRNPAAEQRVTTARGVTVDLHEEDAPVSVENGPVGLGSIPDGSAVPATFQLTVDEDADPGTYDVDVEVEYTYTRAITGNASEDHRAQSVDRELEVELVVEEAPQFEVVESSTTAPVGGNGAVSVRVRNVGEEPAEDATLTLSSSNAGLTFGGAPTAETYVGQWEAGETRLFQYEAAVAPGTERRPIALGATVAYENDDGTPGEAQLTTGVTPRAEQTFAVEAVNASVTPGASGLLTLSLTNTGDRALDDATATVSSPNSVLTFGGTPTAEAFVGTWEAGETRSVPFEVALAEGAPVRAYAVDVTVGYEDAAGNAGQTSLLTGVEPAAEQSFDLELERNTLRVGSEGTLEATVVNRGPSTAENAVLVLEPSSRNLNVGETEFAVGDLAPGDSATASYDVEVSSSASEGPRQFQFRMDYEDLAGDSRQSDPLYLRTNVAAEQPVFEVEPVNASLEAGSTTTLRVEVTNTREKPVSDVSAKLFANDPLSSSDDEAFVDSLEPGETATVEFQLSAAGSAVGKTYPLSLDFQYDDADGDTLVSDTYKLPIEVSERQGGGGGVLSLAPIGGGLLALALGAGIVFRRRR